MNPSLSLTSAVFFFLPTFLFFSFLGFLSWMQQTNNLLLFFVGSCLIFLQGNLVILNWILSSYDLELRWVQRGWFQFDFFVVFLRAFQGLSWWVSVICWFISVNLVTFLDWIPYRSCYISWVPNYSFKILHFEFCLDRHRCLIHFLGE